MSKEKRWKKDGVKILVVVVVVCGDNLLMKMMFLLGVKKIGNILLMVRNKVVILNVRCIFIVFKGELYYSCKYILNCVKCFSEVCIIS